MLIHMHAIYVPHARSACVDRRAGQRLVGDQLGAVFNHPPEISRKSAAA